MEHIYNALFIYIDNLEASGTEDIYIEIINQMHGHTYFNAISLLLMYWPSLRLGSRVRTVIYISYQDITLIIMSDLLDPREEYQVLYQMSFTQNNYPI